ncbi:hypothetical protein LOTGIDRAFT_174033 [Lottia gigantea]|uniref:Uncharacterized protein n=1 Tax=Lottia gigantea TaxID=225164 RepID=V4APA9_LOTGI|nr:hypothetical protein LOTGIDRAFT_174033 [Lottia gigantea]ESO99032.1 hypothetical protein LOTGIDRAFT_174033 [Lottia gigantea]
MAAPDFVLVPTKPRGPIAAMYTSPGPCYGLPNLTGVSAHDPRSNHFRKPAFSFGIRHGKVRDDCSPGPCYLPNSKMSRSGKGGMPEFSLYSRNREPTVFRTPGPGAYKPENAGKSSRRSRPGYTLSGRPKNRKTDHTPAANSYTLPSMTCTTHQSGKRQAPCFSLQGRNKTGGFAEDMCKTPGPGAYSTTDPNISKSRAPLFSMAGRGTLPGDTTQKPGPGAHSPQNVWLDKRKTPEYSFGIRHSPFTAPLIIEVID